MKGGARIRLGVPAALAALWAAIPLAWNGAPSGGWREAALVAGALAVAAALALLAAALVARRPGARPEAFAGSFALTGALAAFATLAAVGRAAGLGGWAWAATYGPASAFLALALLVPLWLWARAAAPDRGGPPRPLGGALFEWLGAVAAIVALPLADRAARVEGRAGDAPAIALLLIAAIGIAAVVAAVAAARARRGIAPRAAAIDAVPSAPLGAPPSRFAAELADLDREIARLEAAYAEALDAQGALIEQRRRTRERKAKVFASMSHDLRGPLNSIAGFSDLLLKGIDGELSGPQRDTVVEISREAERLLVLTGDILDTAKLDAGRFELDRVWVPIVELLAACEDGAARVAAAKGIGLRTVLRPGMPPVLVDKERIVSAVLGLVSRAADAMDGGALVLSVRQMSSLEEGRDYALLELVDAERRADPAWRERAFDVFAALEGVAIPGESGGLALGLALVERILRLHGGELAVGAAAEEPVFTVVLPLDPVEDEG